MILCVFRIFDFFLNSTFLQAKAILKLKNGDAMSVRTAELVMALIMGAVSIALMVNIVSELNIGWQPGSGPGAGAWPFWLACGMLICCAVILVRWFRHQTPESRDQSPFMSRAATRVIFPAIAMLVLILIGFETLGSYPSILLFLFIFIRFLGGHGWGVTLGLSLITPIFIFFLFEGALKISMPKGNFEELYYPLYELIY